nr:AMP-binding protein [Nostoc sp. CreGUA01]
MTTTIEPQELLSQKIYWLNKLSGELPETNLIPDYVRPTQYSGKNKSHNFELPIHLSQVIIKLTNGSDFLVYLILLSSLQILLQKYTKNNDVIVGMPVYKKIDALDLDYLNNDKVIPLRTQINHEITFKNFCNQVKNNVIEAYSHQDYSFNELIELLNLPQSPNRCPIFDIVVLLENIHHKTELAKLNNDITISFLVENDVISGLIEYNQLIFKDDSIKLMSHYYINVVESIISDINIKISDIVFLKDCDRHQLIEQYNNNVNHYPITQTINELFEKQVVKTPNNTAVIHERNKLTYQQLNEKANQLAVILRKLGISKGEFVGIFKDRDINFLIAILAIYKAGGAYIPIDSTYPPSRIEYMLFNSEVKLILTDYSLLNVLNDLIDSCPQLKSIICLDEVVSENVKLAGNKKITIYDKLDFSHLPKNNLEQRNEAVDPAYMLYTSGSTGLPKGAIV